jgi:hypothetical protein
VYAVEDFSLSVVKGSLGGLASTDDDASAKNFRACHFHRFALQGFCVGVGLPLLRHTLLLLLKTSHHRLLRASQGHVDKPVENLWITFVSSETYPQVIHRMPTAVDNL